MKYLSIFIYSSLLLLGGCGTHSGSQKPNFWIADFDKYGEAYYLNTNQIKIGDNKTIVTKEFGTKHETSMAGSIETWKYSSYRATGFRDPIDKYVYVDFKNDHVIDVREELLGRRNTPQTTQPDPFSKLQKLKDMHDSGVLNDKEYEAKKKEILDRL